MSWPALTATRLTSRINFSAIDRLQELALRGLEGVELVGVVGERERGVSDDGKRRLVIIEQTR
jgi:hypothetical protein